MATKRKVATKKRVPSSTARPKLRASRKKKPAPPEITQLRKSETLDQVIAAMIEPRSSVPKSWKDRIKAALANRDPLTNVPRFLRRPLADAGYTLSEGPFGTTIRFGQAHGWDVRLHHYKEANWPGGVKLEVGCRSFKAQRQARDHWSGNMSPSGKERPNATELINFIADVCQYRGWNW